MMRLDPVGADLRWRGFSREITPDGREPFGYDYEQISFTSPWKVMPGRYTREGDVRELLLKSDDMFVISRPGDEISLSFDACKCCLFKLAGLARSSSTLTASARRWTLIQRARIRCHLCLSMA